jgi:hypothetical protein
MGLWRKLFPNRLNEHIAALDRFEAVYRDFSQAVAPTPTSGAQSRRRFRRRSGGWTPPARI